MKNKYELKKLLNKIFLLSIILLIGFVIIKQIEYKNYIYNTNKKIENIISLIEKKYPSLSDNEIIEILNNEKINETDFFKKYGIDTNNEMVIKTNAKDNNIFTIINIIYFIGSIVLILLVFLMYNRKKDKDIESITKYIKEINKKNYHLKIEDMSEDELSILKNEVYKITVMLKEQAENEANDKLKLKDSLSDISHQLKTPLTSIMILLDNLIDNPEMDKDTRNDFIKEIKIEINNINFLVQAILKLSKFDSNTVEFINKKVKLSHLIDNSIKKLLPLCDLKNIKINVDIQNDGILVCDELWQVEAITNIVKNCVEHSNNDSKVDIIINQNNVYSNIIIKDYGKGIDKKDLPHIFDRFYKGKNSSKDSIGIGLALSKTIIEKNNGKVMVESEIDKGTTFIIKYFY